MPTIKRTALSRARVAGICGAVMLLLSACGTLGPTPAVGQGSAATPTYDPSAGFSLAVDATFVQPPTPEQMVQWYGLIVTGTITQTLPSQWSTPDGTRPKHLDYATVPATYAIITPMVLTLDGAPLLNRYGADVSSGQIVIAGFGGQVGNDQVIFESLSPLQVGQHVVIGLSDRPFSGDQIHVPYQTPAGPAWTEGSAYIFTTDGQLIPHHPTADELIDAHEFIQAINDAARSTP